MVRISDKSRGPSRWDCVRAWALNIAAPLGFLSFVLEYGFFLPKRATNYLHLANALVVFYFVVDAAIRWFRSPHPREHLRQYFAEWIMIALLVVQGMLYGIALSWEGGEHLKTAVLPVVTRAYIVAVQLYLLLRFGFAFAEWQSRIGEKSLKPPVLLAASFALVIAFGTFMLMTPRAAGRDPDAAPAMVRFVNALFTSTSAACVTGLTVVDTASAFSRHGQLWVLSLIQVGGLGLATFGALFGVLHARKMSVRGSVMMRDLLSVDVVGQVGKFLLWTVGLTFAIELIGACLLYLWFPHDAASSRHGIWWGVFHSVSAFCNAGFGLERANFADFPGHWGINLVMMALITLGGIGFPVLIELGTRPWRREPGRLPRPAGRITLHSRIALKASAALVIGGALLIWAFEAGGDVMRGRSAGEHVLVPLFQSVSTRTAGFNTVDIGALRDGTLVVVMALMVVGASPVSTGGGLKTVTLVVLAGTVAAMMRGRPRVEMARRTIPRLLVHSAIAIVCLYFTALFVVSLALCVTDPGKPYLKLLFETISALSTVGLSTGITAGLSVGGKLLLCAAMFFGRVGPLAILMSLSGRQEDAQYEYPEESVIVG